MFSLQLMQLTSAEDNTNAQFAITQVGCKEKDRQLKVFIEIFAIRNFFAIKKSCTICNQLV
ncbi:hypothetical protein SU86_002770 [Candidatus Nitrosotenuis cloacae]|uniref:Uncharacterized protein n=1 Tax=Candidatus Nitrosotenuis cloacae TaxID=1603555 RepID=A0A3G1B023_9ARCH|nr:hypothetical protein SU86_002770 [Candidatus Nitrosotenuis cloacae]